MARKQPISQTQVNNEQVLAERQKRIDDARKPIPDLGLNLEQAEPTDAAEFLSDEWDRKTFGDPVPTYKKVVYGPDPLIDQCPAMKAAIERVGLHDYAAATYQAVIEKGEMAVPDNILRVGLSATISRFGRERTAQAFHDRILTIPSRVVEYEADRDIDPQVAGSNVLGEAVDRHRRAGMHYRFLSPGCINGLVGRRGYQIVIDEKGDPVKVGTLMLGEIRMEIIEARRRRIAQEATAAIDDKVAEYAQSIEDIARQSKHAGVRPLRTDEEMNVNAAENTSLIGESRRSGLTFEDQIHG